MSAANQKPVLLFSYPTTGIPSVFILPPGRTALHGTPTTLFKNVTEGMFRIFIFQVQRR
jgi:hypothetical protein